MRKYTGPRDQLDAAGSADTPTEELERLISSEYAFVRLAVAQNPKTPPGALDRILPAVLETYTDQQIAESIAKRADSPPALFQRLSTALLPHLHGGRDSRPAFGAAVALCSNPDAPFTAIAALLSPAASKPQFRKVVARESTRLDVLAILRTDVSSVVAARANATLLELAAGKVFLEAVRP